MALSSVKLAQIIGKGVSKHLTPIRERLARLEFDAHRERSTDPGDDLVLDAMIEAIADLQQRVAELEAGR